MGNKIIIALAALVIAALAGFGIKWHFDSVAALKQKLAIAQHQVQATDAALTAKQKALASMATKYREQQKALSDALAQNQAWAGTAVPDSVFNSLFHSTDPAP